MGVGKYRRVRSHKGIKDLSKKFRTKRRPRDLDQIHDDLLQKEALLHAEPNEELPGLGQHLCVECNRHFIDQLSFDNHVKSKVHKRRLKLLKDEPYSQKEAERAAGMTHE